MLTVSDVTDATSRVRARPHAIVIGSGFGGLAAALRLLARGYRVTVLEKLDAPGGRGYQFRQDGFTFDCGPTIITAPFLFEELWALFGQRMQDHVDLRPVSPFYDVRFADGETFRVSGDADAMRAEVARFNPGDIAGFERFLKRSEEIYRLGFEPMGDAPFNSLLDMARVAPNLLRLEGHRSVYAVVSKYLSDERLRTVFSFHPLLIGGSPFRASSIFCLISYLERRFGVHYAMGGMGALVRGLVDLIASQGGELRLKAEVEEIVVSNGAATGVRLASGETIEASIVVSNADSAWTYRKLVPSSARWRWTDRKIDRSRYSMGVFVWHFGVDRRYDDLSIHTILLGPRYRELVQDIFDRKILAEDFSLYLYRPTAVDPSMAPAGCDSFYALSPVPNLLGGQDWRTEAETYRKRIEQALEATVLPNLSSAILTSRMTTPLDFQHRLNSYRGAAFALEPILTQSAWFRPHNMSEDVRNLFLVGAGTHPGAGLPGVLSSARVLDKVVPHASVFV
jgi:phytoene desaturase